MGILKIFSCYRMIVIGKGGIFMNDEFNFENNETPLTQITETDYAGNDNSRDTESQYTENDFLRAYIGEKADDILNSNVNIYAAFFGPLWFIYRRCIGIAIGLSFLVSLVSELLAKLIEFKLLTSVFSFLFYLFCSNYIYVSNAKSNVRRIIKKNSKLSNDALMELIKNKGGVKVRNVVITVVLIVISVLLLFLAYYYIFIMFLKALGG